MQVEKIMTKSVVTVSMDDNLKFIKQIFSKTHFHHLLVVENNILVGIISDRDLFKSLSPNVGTASETEKDAATLNKRAHQIMSRSPISLTSDADIYEAIAIFNRSDISCIPIVNNAKKPIGILSWRDILRILEKLRNHSK